MRSGNQNKQESKSSQPVDAKQEKNHNLTNQFEETRKFLKFVGDVGHQERYLTDISTKLASDFFQKNTSALQASELKDLKESVKEEIKRSLNEVKNALSISLQPKLTMLTPEAKQSVTAEDWTATIDHTVKPLLNEIQAHIAMINAPSVAEGKHDRDGGLDRERKKLHQVDSLNTLKKSIETEVEKLKYDNLVKALKEHVFWREEKSNRDYTLQQRAREKLDRDFLQREFKPIYSNAEWNGQVVELGDAKSLKHGVFTRKKRNYSVDEHGITWVASKFDAEAMDEALMLYARHTGKKDGYLSVGENVPPSEILKMMKHAQKKGFELKLSTATAQRLQKNDPTTLQAIRQIEESYAQPVGGIAAEAPVNAP